MKEIDAVIAGYTCVDLTPEFKKNGVVDNVSDLLIPGKLIEVDGLDFVLGGAVPNTGLAMKRFDKRVFLNGLIGKDFVGKLAMDWLKKNDLAEGIVSTADGTTAYSIVLAPPGIDRIYLESPGCNKIFDTSFVNFNAVSRCRVFHFGYPPLLRRFYLNNGEMLSGLFSKVHEMGVVTSLDFSLPDPESESGKANWPSILRETLPYVDIFVPSLEETLQIIMPEKYSEIRASAGTSDIIDLVPLSLVREAGRLIIDYGVKILLIKAGARGAYLITGDVSPVCKKSGINLKAKDWDFREFLCNAYKADESRILNASGAGDAANAAFLSAILDGEPPEMAVKLACIAGRNNLYFHGSYPDNCNWDTMKEEIMTTPDQIVRF